MINEMLILHIMKKTHLVKNYLPRHSAYNCFCGSVVEIYQADHWTNNPDDVTCANCIRIYNLKNNNDEKQTTAQHRQ